MGRTRCGMPRRASLYPLIWSATPVWCPARLALETRPLILLCTSWLLSVRWKVTHRFSERVNLTENMLWIFQNNRGVKKLKENCLLWQQAMLWKITGSQNKKSEQVVGEVWWETGRIYLHRGSWFMHAWTPRASHQLGSAHDLSVPKSRNGSGFKKGSWSVDSLFTCSHVIFASSCKANWV